MIREIFLKILENENIIGIPKEEEITPEEQFEFIKSYISNSKNIKKCNIIKNIVSSYSNFKINLSKDKAEYKECDEVIVLLEDYLKNIDKVYISSYNELYNYLISLKDRDDCEFKYNNVIIYLLLSYEGIRKDKTFAKLSLSDFKSEKKEYWIELKEENIVIPIHKETYEFIVNNSNTYEQVFQLEIETGKLKIYKYYPFFTEDKNYSIFRTTIENNQMNEEKFLTFKSNLSRKAKEKFNLSGLTVYNYGRWETLFNMELLYENAESLASKSSKLFDYECFKWFGIEKTSTYKYRREYIEWRKKAIEKIISK